MCSQTSYSAPGVNFNLAIWISNYAVFDTLFPLENQDTFSTPERTAIINVKSWAIDMKMLLNKSLPQFSVDLKMKDGRIAAIDIPTNACVHSLHLALNRSDCQYWKARWIAGLLRQDSSGQPLQWLHGHPITLSSSRLWRVWSPWSSISWPSCTCFKYGLPLAHVGFITTTFIWRHRDWIKRSLINSKVHMASSTLRYKLNLTEHSERCKALYFFVLCQPILLTGTMALTLDSWSGEVLLFRCLQEESNVEDLALLLNSGTNFPNPWMQSQIKSRCNVFSLISVACIMFPGM